MDIFNKLYENYLAIINSIMDTVTYGVYNILNINDLRLTIFISLFIVLYTFSFIVSKISFKNIRVGYFSFLMILFFSPSSSTLFVLDLDKAIQSASFVLSLVFIGSALIVFKGEGRNTSNEVA